MYIYGNNLRCNSFLSLSDKIILNQNITLNSPFVTPISNQLGYQVFGTFVDNTSITSNTFLSCICN